MKFSILIFLIFFTLATNAAGDPHYEKANDRFKSDPSGPILPSKYGIKNNGTLISKTNLHTWLSACKYFRRPVYFPAGTYLLPPDFEFDFENTDLSIIGDGPGKTILTTNNGAATNFAIPEKINLTKQKPEKDGVYQVDITASHLHRDYITVPGIVLDSYIRVKKGLVEPISFATVKELGYVTELDATAPDPGIDGLYVVARHASHDYGGGFKHLKLGYNGTPLYVQGTVLQRKEGIWSRFYSSVAFICESNFSVRNICFSNFRPYLFLPASKKNFKNRNSRDHFLIEHCRFEQTARVLATSTYGGISDSPNWYKASSLYPVNLETGFKYFTIKSSEFSYIHETIVWGAPPAMFYNVNHNNIHDCYTILNCFYLFPPYNRNMPINNNNRFSIYKNTFLRIRALNPGSENSVQLIRTLNKGTIADNIFIDCTGIHLYLNAATVVRNNIIKTFMVTVPSKQTRPPLVLVKIAKNEMISFDGNKFSMGMMGNLVANESQASFTFKNNKLTGAAVRYITSLTKPDQKLDAYRTYTITDTAVFYKIAGIESFDPAIRLSNTVYFNKRISRWEALSVLPQMFLYSEVDQFIQNKQTVVFINNEIEAGYLTRIQKKVSAKYGAVTFKHNLVQYCTGLLAANDSTVIESFNFTGNTVRNGTLQMTSLGDVSSSVISLNISGNKFYVDFTGAFSFAASGLILFRDNIFIRNNAFNFNNAAAYSLFGLSALPAPSFSLTLKGHEGQHMAISGNSFIAEMTRGGIIQVTDPDKVTIANNSFELNIPSWQAPTVTSRNAIHFNTTKPVSFIKIYGNKYFPEAGKKNYLVGFDNGHSAILDFINEANFVVVNETAVIKTVLAANKSFTNYTNLKNRFADKETILSVTNRKDKL